MSSFTTEGRLPRNWGVRAGFPKGRKAHPARTPQFRAFLAKLTLSNYSATNGLSIENPVCPLFTAYCLLARKAIPHPKNGLDILRVLRVVLKFGAQVFDVGIYGAFIAFEGCAL